MAYVTRYSIISSVTIFGTWLTIKLSQPHEPVHSGPKRGAWVIRCFDIAGPNQHLAGLILLSFYTYTLAKL